MPSPEYYTPRTCILAPLMGWGCYGIGGLLVPRFCQLPPSHQLTMF